MRPQMARRRNALPFISEPTWKTENIASFLQAEESRRGSVGSVRQSNEPKKVTVSTNGSSDLTGDSHQPKQRYKLLVIGDSGCGKTCLLNALVRSEFDTEESCIFDECVTDITTGGSRVEFMLWDISGLEDYESIRKEMYRDSDVILLCFDIGHPPSLQSVVDKWLPEINDACPGVPFLLIGCKNDLRTDSALQYYLSVPSQDTAEDVDSISRVKALSVAQSIMARDYIECCAKTRWNIKEVFRCAADAILHKDDPKGGEPKPQSVLRKFPWFSRRPSASDMSDYNSASRSVPGNRRLSLFSTG